jgi:hypothetical protein
MSVKGICKADPKTGKQTVEWTMVRNEARKGIEIRFTDTPYIDVRTQLKGLKFRFHGPKKMWYAKDIKDRWLIVSTTLGVTSIKTEPESDMEYYREQMSRPAPAPAVEDPEPEPNPYEYLHLSEYQAEYSLDGLLWKAIGSINVGIKMQAVMGPDSHTLDNWEPTVFELDYKDQTYRLALDLEEKNRTGSKLWYCTNGGEGLFTVPGCRTFWVSEQYHWAPHLAFSAIINHLLNPKPAKFYPMQCPNCPNWTVDGNKAMLRMAIVKGTRKNVGMCEEAGKEMEGIATGRCPYL